MNHKVAARNVRKPESYYLFEQGHFLGFSCKDGILEYRTGIPI